jgi:hypothetical protein
MRRNLFQWAGMLVEQKKIYQSLVNTADQDRSRSVRTLLSSKFGLGRLFRRVSRCADQRHLQSLLPLANDAPPSKLQKLLFAVGEGSRLRDEQTG